MSVIGQASKMEPGLAVVFGPPGLATAAAVETLRAIAQAALQDGPVQEINSMTDWNRACESGQKFIGLSEYPSPEICEYIVDRGIPAIVVVDDPLRSVAHLAGDRLSDIAAVRAISASVSCLAGMLAQRRPEIEEANARNLTAFLFRLAEASGIEVYADDIERIDSQAGRLASRLDDICRHRHARDLPPPSSCGLATAALPKLQDLQPMAGDIGIVWPLSSFLLGDFPDMPMRSRVDLAGPARCLLYGPYLHLPPGRWHALVTLQLAGCHGTQSFAIEIACGDVIARGRFQVDGAGIFETEIEFIHASPHTPIELRLFLEAGAIYGWLKGFEVGFPWYDPTFFRSRTACKRPPPEISRSSKGSPRLEL